MILALLFLIGGAIVNVAVAWTASLTTHFEYSISTSAATLEDPLLDDFADWTPRAFIRERDVEGVFRWSRAPARAELVLSFGRPTTLGRPIIRVARVNSGWPMAALTARVGQKSDRGGREVRYEDAVLTSVRIDDFFGFMMDHETRVLPLQPIVTGFIINTLFYALLLWLLFFAPFAARRMLRRRRGQCEKCAYPIGVSPVCTECGAALPRKVEA